MDFAPSARAEALRTRVREFVDQKVIPSERQDLWAHPGRLDEVRRELQRLARARGLWLPHLPAELGGLGLDWRDTAVVLEEAGRSLLGPRSLNAAAPDDGNMRTLAFLATPRQKESFLLPVLQGEARSCFAMTEPAPGAGSDPSLLQTTAEHRNGRWVINGRKWFITGAEGAAFAIVLARTAGGATMFLVSRENPGFRLGDPIGTIDSFSPGGHSELAFVDCEVDDDAVLGEVDKGFEHAQYRLAPARLTHCMRWLGAANRALEIASAYVRERRSFGKPLASHQLVAAMVADSHIDLQAARLLVAQAAWCLDHRPPTKVKHESSIAKVFVSEAVNRVIDRCVQMCGGWGTAEASMLAHLYRDARPFRIYDGANEVHRASIARRVLKVAA